MVVPPYLTLFFFRAPRAERLAVRQSCAEYSLRSPEVDLSLDTAMAAIQALSGDPESQRLVRELSQLVNHVKAALGVDPLAGILAHGRRSP